MDTLARICETLNCEITDVIELVPDEPASAGGKEHERIETKNNGRWTYLADLNEQAQERLDAIMEQMKATEGVTEELKRTC